MGEKYEQSGNPDKAREIYVDLYRRNSSNPMYFNSLNRIYILLKQYDASVKLVEQRLSINPQDINLYGLLGSTYYLMGDETKAFSIWDNGINKVPQNQINYKLMANYAIERRAFEKAIDFLKRGKKISDNPILFSFDLANLYSITMQYKEAAEEYLSIAQRNPEQNQAVQNGLLSYINKVDALQITIDVFEKKRDEDNINTSYLLATLYLQGKMFEKAYGIFSEIDSKLKSHGLELLKFAMELYNEHQYELGVKVFGDIIDRYPSSPIISSAKLGYVKTLEAKFESENNSETELETFFIQQDR